MTLTKETIEALNETRRRYIAYINMLRTKPFYLLTSEELVILHRLSKVQQKE